MKKNYIKRIILCKKVTIQEKNYIEKRLYGKKLYKKKTT